jgi:DNA-binding response OmpR family regulator
MRAHLVRNAKESILQLYGLEETPKEERIKQVEYLLDNDRFTCAEDAYEVSLTPQGVALLTHRIQSCGKRFLASQIPRFIHNYFFIRTRTVQGWGRDPKTRIKSINATFISFICSALYWALKLQLESDKAGVKKNDSFVPDIG